MHYTVTKIKANKMYCFGENFHVGPQLVKTVSHIINATNPTEVTNALIRIQGKHRQL
jgi:hypothetical protein